MALYGGVILVTAVSFTALYAAIPRAGIVEELASAAMVRQACMLRLPVGEAGVG